MDVAPPRVEPGFQLSCPGRFGGREVVALARIASEVVEFDAAILEPLNQFPLPGPDGAGRAAARPVVVGEVPEEGIARDRARVVEEGAETGPVQMLRRPGWKARESQQRRVQVVGDGGRINEQTDPAA